MVKKLCFLLLEKGNGMIPAQLIMVAVQDIEPKPLFSFSYGRNEKVTESIERWGVLNPVLLLKEADGRKWLMDGNQRYLAARELGRERLPALVYEAGQLSRGQGFLLSLAANLEKPFISEIEKAQIMTQAQGILEAPVLESEVLPALGVRDKRQVRSYLRLMQFPEEVKEVIHRANWPFHVASKLLLFTPSEAASVLSELKKFPFNQNKMAETLEWLNDLSKKEKQSPVEMLKGFLKNLAGTGQSPGDALREALKKKRFARLEEKRHEFESIIKKMKVPAGVSVTPSPFFEEGYVEVKCQLGESEALESVRKFLAQDEWSQLLQLVN